MKNTELASLATGVVLLAAWSAPAAAQPATPAAMIELTGVRDHHARTDLGALLPADIPGLGRRAGDFTYGTAIEIMLDGEKLVSWKLDERGATYLFHKTKDPTLGWLLSTVYGKPPDALRARFGEPFRRGSDQTWHSARATYTVTATLDAAGKVTHVRVLDVARRAAQVAQGRAPASPPAPAPEAAPYPSAVARQLKAACLRRKKAPHDERGCTCLVERLPARLPLRSLWGAPPRTSRNAPIEEVARACATP